MGFGQLVIGAPGCGKTTYCHGVSQFLNAAGRETVVVNLDPGNDLLPYECAVDVMDLIRLEDAMEEFNLGPNGGLVYCMEYIEQNLDWLEEEIKAKCDGKYILFDLPGQVELYTHHESVRAISQALVSWGIQVCAVHLVDGHHCSDASKFLSTALVALAAMTMLELPHVNVLSKIDLIRALGKLDFNLDYYLRSSELEHLPRLMRVRDGLGRDSDSSEAERGAGTEDGDDDDINDSTNESRSDAGRVPYARKASHEDEHAASGDGAPARARARVGRQGRDQIRDSQRRWRKLEQAIAGLITSYDLVHFIPLSIKDKDTVAHACRFIDKSNGYLYSGLKGQIDGDTCGLGRPLELDDILDLVEERYMFDPDDPYDEKSDSSDDQVPEADLAELSTALASGSLGS